MEKVAFLFPGQGSQYIGMSRTLFEEFELYRQTFEEASDILGFDLAKQCFEGSLLDLAKTENSLIAIFTSSVAAFRVYMKEIAIAPQVCAGHSLGEYSALTCSGAIKFPDAVRLVYKRAKLAKVVSDTDIGAMSIIDGNGMDIRDIVEEECIRASGGGREVVISCYNTLKQVDISGHKETVMQVEQRLLEHGAQVTPLIGVAPFHCTLMQPAVGELREELMKCRFSGCRWPVISNVTGLPHVGPEKVAEALANQITSPVQWETSMEYLERIGITLTVELGPKNVLSSFIQANGKKIKAMSFDHI